MNRIELVDIIKQYCLNNKIKFIDDIKVGNDILILVAGVDSAKKLKECLLTLNVKHTTPLLVADAIGSYVSLY